MGEGQILKLFNLDNIRQADTEGREGHGRTHKQQRSFSDFGRNRSSQGQQHLLEVART